MNREGIFRVFLGGFPHLGTLGTLQVRGRGFLSPVSAPVPVPWFY